MANDIRICKTCGAEYKYCPTCAKYANKPSWMWKCDTEECNEIFDSISAYKMGVGNVDKIKNVIQKYDIKDYSKYVDSVKNTLNELVPINTYKSYRKNKHKYNMDIDLNEEAVAVEEQPTETSIDLEGISEE